MLAVHQISLLNAHVMAAHLHGGVLRRIEVLAAGGLCRRWLSADAAGGLRASRRLAGSLVRFVFIADCSG